MTEDRTELPEGWKLEPQTWRKRNWRAVQITAPYNYTEAHPLKSAAIAAAWRIVDVERERGE